MDGRMDNREFQQCALLLKSLFCTKSNIFAGIKVKTPVILHASKQCVIITYKNVLLLFLYIINKKL